MMHSENKKKYVMAFIMVGLMAAIIFYLTLKIGTATETSEVIEPKNALQKNNSQISMTEEEKKQANTTSEIVISRAEEVEVLYDTKSDMNLQPIDPETDPANKIDNIGKQ